jgi:hypothetical protein
MIGAISLLGVTLASALAFAADGIPNHVKLMESCAGALFIGGLALLGSALPFVP